MMRALRPIIFCLSTPDSFEPSFEACCPIRQRHEGGAILRVFRVVHDPAVCRLFNQIIAGKSLPRYLSSDHDPLFRFHRWLANLRVIEVEGIKAIPYVPLSHPFVERLIGTIRREYLDHVFFWNGIDLTRKLDEFKDYYNRHRVHRSLDGTTPARRASASSLAPAALNHYAWRQHCRGLFQTPIAVEL